MDFTSNEYSAPRAIEKKNPGGRFGATSTAILAHLPRNRAKWAEFKTVPRILICSIAVAAKKDPGGPPGCPRLPAAAAA